MTSGARDLPISSTSPIDPGSDAGSAGRRARARRRLIEVDHCVRKAVDEHTVMKTEVIV